MNRKNSKWNIDATPTIKKVLNGTVKTERADHSIQAYAIPTPIIKKVDSTQFKWEVLHLHAPQQQHEQLHLVL